MVSSYIWNFVCSGDTCFGDSCGRRCWTAMDVIQGRAFSSLEVYLTILFFNLFSSHLYLHLVIQQQKDWGNDGHSGSTTEHDGHDDGGHHSDEDHIDPQSRPYLVSIGSHHSSHACGGTLISKSVVLTAAHCFTNQESGTFKALEWADFNRHNLAENDDVVRVYLSNYEGEDVIRHKH